MTNIADAGMAHAGELAKWLRSALLEHQHGELSRSDEPIGDGSWQPLPMPFSLEEQVVQPFGEIIDSLDRILTEAEYRAKSSKWLLASDEFWTLGSTTRCFPIRNIHIGFVEPVLRIPIISRLPEAVIAFLLAIPGERDLLKREHHNQVGWHYHYLDFKQARSNLVLCWDTRAAHRQGNDHSLFQETHAESHADFKARPDLWGITKKKSMHDVCAPDLDRWPLSTFRCASAKAQPVWPVSARVTPMPVPRH